MRRPTRKVGRRPAALIISDSEEDELDQRALSPHTRMSITGIRPQDIGDDSSEIDYSDADLPKTTNAHSESPRYSTQFAGRIENSLHSTQFPIDDNLKDETHNSSASIENSLHSTQSLIEENPKDNTHNSSRSIVNSLHSTQSLMEETPKDETHNSSGSIENSLHSIQSLIEENPKDETHNSSGSDVMILSNKEVTIEISSGSDDNNENEENIRPKSNLTPAPKRQRSILELISKKNVVKSQNDLFMESKKLIELNQALKDTEELYITVGHKLPDGGAEIKKRIDGLRREISVATKLQDGGNKILQDKPQKPNVPSKPVNNELDWDTLSAAVNDIQPKYTGARGMATFNNQKTLTVDSLKVPAAV